MVVMLSVAAVNRKERSQELMWPKIDLASSSSLGRPGSSHRCHLRINKLFS